MRSSQAKMKKANLGYWALQLLGWGFYYYAQASGEAIFASVPENKAATLWGVVSLAGIGSTHLMRWAIRRFGWLALPPVAFVIRIVAGTLLIATTSYLITLAMSQAVY